jgi:excisionase family DNA binding protein
MPDTLASTKNTPIAYSVRGVGGICDLTGWSPAFVYRLIEDGRLPAVRVGRSVRVLHRDLAEFLESHRVDTNGAA